MSKKKRSARKAAPAAPKKQRIEFVARPFAGIPREEDLVALAQVVPAATARVRLTQEYGGGEVTLVTLLPELAQGMKRPDGEVLVALQTTMHSGDASRDVAAALLATLELEPGRGLLMEGLPEPGPRLQDVLDLTVEPVVEVHEDFSYWLSADQVDDESLVHTVEDSKEGMVPTVPVPGVEHAYWCRMGGKEFVRWARGEDEDDFFKALARVHAARESDLEEGAHFIGAFRAYGLAIPVWQLNPGTEAEELTAPLQAMAARLKAALAVEEPLTAAERKAKAGIISRQVNL